MLVQTAGFLQLGYIQIWHRLFPRALSVKYEYPRPAAGQKKKPQTKPLKPGIFQPAQEESLIDTCVAPWLVLVVFLL